MYQNIYCRPSRTDEIRYWYKNFLNHKNQVIIDVRSSQAHNDWRIFGSINIPFKMFQSGEFKELLPNSKNPLTIVCNRGNDSKIIANILNNNGIKAISLSKTSYKIPIPAGIGEHYIEISKTK